MNREQLTEPTFGQELHPILEVIHKAIWEHNANFEGERPMYSDEDMLFASTIIIDVLLDRMFAIQEKHKVEMNVRLNNANEAGTRLRMLIKEFTGLDMPEMMKKWMEK